MEGHDGEAARRHQRAGDLHLLTRSPSRATESASETKTWNWSTSEARPAGMPSFMPRNISANCAANIVKP
ncbi:hypothetical protein [Oleiharenicola sp. Vm1]|uniref:hypothetical protein n=1 Tax=Oleiharenicola sp. Vm1 TaxID=3398393 RepID=UPI0039F4F895